MVTFRMAYGRAVPYLSGIGVVFLLILSVKLIAVKVWWLGGASLFVTALMALFIYRFYKHPPVYVIDDNTITLKHFWQKAVYPIDRIVRIQYFDLGVEYSTGPNNARRQLGLYFDRKLYKSVEPRAVCPDDRDGFVEALLARNPDIQVDRQDIRPK